MIDALCSTQCRLETNKEQSRFPFMKWCANYQRGDCALDPSCAIPQWAPMAARKMASLEFQQDSAPKGSVVLRGITVVQTETHHREIR